MLARLNRISNKATVLLVPFNISLWSALAILRTWDGWPAWVASAAAFFVSLPIALWLSHKWLAPSLLWLDRKGAYFRAAAQKSKLQPNVEAEQQREAETEQNFQRRREFEPEAQGDPSVGNATLIRWWQAKQKAGQQWNAKQEEDRRKRSQFEDSQRQRQAEAERQPQAEAERQWQAEAERRRMAEAERQRQAEAERQWQAEAERQRMAEAERRRMAEAGRQRRATEERLNVWIGLGTKPLNVDMSQRFGLPMSEGVYVSKVMAQSPAAVAGLLEGDIIRSVDDVGVANPLELEARLRLHSPGEAVHLTVWRNGRTNILPVVLGRTENRTGHEFMASQVNAEVNTLMVTAKPPVVLGRTENRIGHERMASQVNAEVNTSMETAKLRTEAPPSIIPEKEMLEFLLDLSGYTAWCCGFANRMADGTVVKDTSHFHLDHLDPKSKGGSNQITNRAPMCAKHNLRKSDRRVHLEDYRVEIAGRGELKVGNMSGLVDLTWAYQQALDRYSKAQSEVGPPATASRQSRTGRKSTRARPSTRRRSGTR